MIQGILNWYADSLQKTWAHDRTQTIGASEIGQCARKTFWIKNEIDPKHRAERDAEYQDGWGAKIRGTIMENEFWTPAAIISSQHAPLMAAAMAGGIARRDRPQRAGGAAAGTVPASCQSRRCGAFLPARCRP
jgi:hypothetical protein